MSGHFTPDGSYVSNPYQLWRLGSLPQNAVDFGVDSSGRSQSMVTKLAEGRC